MISEKCAEVKLQALLDHTVRNIFKSVDKLDLPDFNNKTITLFSKWGCDGTTGQAQYKQKFNTIDQTEDKDIFLTSFVPITVYTQPNNNPELKEIVWKNPRTSSTKYCRPIRLHFQKETTEFIKKERAYISEQIQNLESTIIIFENGTTVKVKHELMMTMVDGKVCNAISENHSAQKCYVCGAGPKDMNQIDLAKQRPVNKKTFEFGLSTLHAWIRFFECLIHVAYRLEFKKWQAKGDNKVILKEKKKVIQSRFREEMGLLVDMPRSDGSGTSNDGNTARRFFSSPDLSSSITGIEKEIIVRFGVILQVISSGNQIRGNFFYIYLCNLIIL